MKSKPLHKIRRLTKIEWRKGRGFWNVEDKCWESWNFADGHFIPRTLAKLLVDLYNQLPNHPEDKP